MDSFCPNAEICRALLRAMEQFRTCPPTYIFNNEGVPEGERELVDEIEVSIDVWSHLDTNNRIGVVKFVAIYEMEERPQVDVHVYMPPDVRVPKVYSGECEGRAVMLLLLVFALMVENNAKTKYSEEFWNSAVDFVCNTALTHAYDYDFINSRRTPVETLIVACVLADVEHWHYSDEDDPQTLCDPVRNLMLFLSDTMYPLFTLEQWLANPRQLLVFTDGDEQARTNALFRRFADAINCVPWDEANRGHEGSEQGMLACALDHATAYRDAS